MSLQPDETYLDVSLWSGALALKAPSMPGKALSKPPGRTLPGSSPQGPQAYFPFLSLDQLYPPSQAFFLCSYWYTQSRGIPNALQVVRLNWATFYDHFSEVRQHLGRATALLEQTTSADMVRALLLASPVICNFQGSSITGPAQDLFRDALTDELARGFNNSNAVSFVATFGRYDGLHIVRDLRGRPDASQLSFTQGLRAVLHRRGFRTLYDAATQGMKIFDAYLQRKEAYFNREEEQRDKTCSNIAAAIRTTNPYSPADWTRLPSLLRLLNEQSSAIGRGLRDFVQDWGWTPALKASIVNAATDRATDAIALALASPQNAYWGKELKLRAASHSARAITSSDLYTYLSSLPWAPTSILPVTESALAALYRALLTLYGLGDVVPPPVATGIARRYLQEMQHNVTLGRMSTDTRERSADIPEEEGPVRQRRLQGELMPNRGRTPVFKFPRKVPLLTCPCARPSTPHPLFDARDTKNILKPLSMKFRPPPPTASSSWETPTPYPAPYAPGVRSGRTASPTWVLPNLDPASRDPPAGPKNRLTACLWRGNKLSKAHFQTIAHGESLFQEAMPPRTPAISLPSTKLPGAKVDNPEMPAPSPNGPASSSALWGAGTAASSAQRTSEPTGQEAASSTAATPPPSLGFLQYDKNSCFMDSFFMAIMHTPNPISGFFLAAHSRPSSHVYLADAATEVQNDVREIHKTIRSGGRMKCTRLRKHLQNFRHLYNAYSVSPKPPLDTEINWTVDEQEPRDLIVMLDKALVIPNNTIVERGDVSLEVPYTYVMVTAREPGVDVSLHVPINVDTQEKILSSSGLYIMVERGYTDDRGGHKRTFPLHFPTTIALPLSPTLHLISIVAHRGNTVTSGHYLALIKRTDGWYEFDGRNKNLQYTPEGITDFYVRNATGLVYVPAS